MQQAITSILIRCYSPSRGHHPYSHDRVGILSAMMSYNASWLTSQNSFGHNIPCSRMHKHFWSGSCLGGKKWWAYKCTRHSLACLIEQCGIFWHNTIVRKTVKVDAENYQSGSVEFKHQSHSLIFMSMEANMLLEWQLIHQLKFATCQSCSLIMHGQLMHSGITF